MAAGLLVLRSILGLALGGSALYGPLAAPIAIMAWLYLTSLAVLVGAAFNAALESVWPAFSGISREAAAVLHPEIAPEETPPATL